MQKHKKTQLKADIVIEESEEDKRLITGSVISDNSPLYPAGCSVIFGKYALYPLTLQGVDYYFLDVNDVIATTDYTE